jgi:hypothetical protein
MFEYLYFALLNILLLIRKVRDLLEGRKEEIVIFVAIIVIIQRV